MKPEEMIAGKKRPFTAQEYLDSLKDGREVYIYGERVEDVTTLLPSAIQRGPWRSSTTRCTIRLNNRS
jgi:hypothetical protein